MDRDLRYVLQGTARGTVFEGEAWVSELFSNMTEENAIRLISQRFEDRFSYGMLGVLYQKGRAAWAEKYGLLSLFNRGCHYMYMPVREKQFRDPAWEYYPEERMDMLKRGSVLAELSWVSENEIELCKCIRRHTDCDKEEYDELEIWMRGLYDGSGHLKASFTIEEVKKY